MRSHSASTASPTVGIPARAFSLFELLIVVGIITILLAIIAPSGLRNIPITCPRESVFAYHRAIEAWPENPAAHEGLQRTVRAVVEHTLPRGELSVAMDAAAANFPKC